MPSPNASFELAQYLNKIHIHAIVTQTRSNKADNVYQLIYAQCPHWKKDSISPNIETKA